MKVKSESEVAQSCQVLATPWTAAYQAPPSMGFFRQEYWGGAPSPSPTPYKKRNLKLITYLNGGTITLNLLRKIYALI